MGGETGDSDMTKPIRGDKGQFAGSIGDGKTHIPTPADTPLNQVAEEADSEPPLDEVQRLYRDRIRALAVTTDTELSKLHAKQFRLTQTIEIDNDSLHWALGHRRETVRVGRRTVRAFPQSMADTVAEAQEVLENPDTPQYKKNEITKIVTSRANSIGELSEVNHRIHELDAVYEQHHWTRAFLVPGGHVHSSTDACPSLHRGESRTQLVWLPQYSGSDESQIVEDAGERSCTLCYPSAPVDVLSRPTRIYSDEERRELEAAEQRRSQREASRAARAAKAPTASGEPLVLTVGTRESRGERFPRQVELKTERSALTYAVDILAAQRSGNSYLAPYEVSSSHYDETVDAIISSVAEKRGVSKETILTELEPKVLRKLR